MKVELTVPALERLLGGDTAVEASLRQSVVEAFAQRHLKAVVNSELIAAATAEAKQFVNIRLRECFTSDGAPAMWAPVSRYLQERLLGWLADEAASAVKAAVAEAVAAQAAVWRERVRLAVAAAISETVCAVVAEAVRRRVELSVGTTEVATTVADASAAAE